MKLLGQIVSTMIDLSKIKYANENKEKHILFVHENRLEKKFGLPRWRGWRIRFRINKNPTMTRRQQIRMTR